MARFLNVPKVLLSPLTLTFVALLLPLAGCQSGSGTYDEDAKNAAVRAVGDGPFKGVGEVSVGAVRPRETCPQAASPDAGPCLAVDVTTTLEARTLEGDVDPLHRTVEASFDFFVWLKKDDQGRWVVTHSTYRPKGVPDEVRD
jgi:hypothetical protein